MIIIGLLGGFWMRILVMKRVKNSINVEKIEFILKKLENIDF